jgi:hypothetical protein
MYSLLTDRRQHGSNDVGEIEGRYSGCRFQAVMSSLVCAERRPDLCEWIAGRTKWPLDWLLRQLQVLRNIAAARPLTRTAMWREGTTGTEVELKLATSRVGLRKARALPRFRKMAGNNVKSQHLVLSISILPSSHCTTIASASACVATGAAASDDQGEPS